MSVCVCVRACVRACVRVCVCLKKGGERKKRLEHKNQRMYTYSTTGIMLWTQIKKRGTILFKSGGEGII